MLQGSRARRGILEHFQWDEWNQLDWMKCSRENTWNEGKITESQSITNIQIHYAWFEWVKNKRTRRAQNELLTIKEHEWRGMRPTLHCACDELLPRASWRCRYTARKIMKCMLMICTQYEYARGCGRWQYRMFTKTTSRTRIYFAWVWNARVQKCELLHSSKV